MRLQSMKGQEKRPRDCTGDSMGRPRESYLVQPLYSLHQKNISISEGFACSQNGNQAPIQMMLNHMSHELCLDIVGENFGCDIHRNGETKNCYKVLSAPCTTRFASGVYGRHERIGNRPNF